MIRTFVALVLVACVTCATAQEMKPGLGKLRR